MFPFQAYTPSMARVTISRPYRHIRSVHLLGFEARHPPFVPLLLLTEPQALISAQISEYVQVKPVLAVLTMIFKATGTYNDGALKGDSGYTYVSVAYNISVSLSLYCLAMFWVCTNEDLKPYRSAIFSYLLRVYMLSNSSRVGRCQSFYA